MDQIDIKEFDKLPKFIAVEGPIGAGKTTLTKLLADSLNYEMFLEKPSENPFLPDFYINPSQAALATQLFFLFQRVKQIQELKQGDYVVVSKTDTRRCTNPQRSCLLECLSRNEADIRIQGVYIA